MELKKAPLSLDLIDRYSDSHAVIHATGDRITGTHWAVAQVVVRMDGEREDSPLLVKFAHELVNRYNQHDELLSLLDGASKAIAKAIPHLPADDEAIFCGEWLAEINEAISKAKGGAS